jgi:RNA polymerase sigma-70 factor, ECF subfamily
VLKSGIASERTPARSSDTPADISDEKLIERARARDEAAFEELVSRYEDGLYRLAMSFVHDEMAAQEILQDTFLTAWRSLPSLEGRPPFTSWIFRLTVSAALMRSRYQESALDNLGPTVFDEVLAEGGNLLRTRTDWSQQPVEQLRSGKLREHIRASFDALPRGLQTVFLLRDIEDLSAAETAEILGLSGLVVEARLHRTRMALRSAIGVYVDSSGTR